MSWYYSENNQRQGPVDESAFQALVAQGKITPTTLVWREGMPNWSAYSEVGGVATAPPPMAAAGAALAGPSAKCVECGRLFPIDEMVNYEGRYICPQCKPIFFQKVKEGALVPGTRIYAGFWIRFGAAFIDLIILRIVQFLISLGVGAMMGGGRTAVNITTALALLLGIAYETYFIGGPGATLGKMALKLKVIRADGTAVGYPLALGRYFAKILSGLILLIGYIMAGFDDEKRALHDRICDTRVVRE